MENWALFISKFTASFLTSELPNIFIITSKVTGVWSRALGQRFEMRRKIARIYLVHCCRSQLTIIIMLLFDSAAFRWQKSRMRPPEKKHSCFKTVIQAQEAVRVWDGRARCRQPIFGDSLPTLQRPTQTDIGGIHSQVAEKLRCRCARLCEKTYTENVSQSTHCGLHSLCRSRKTESAGSATAFAATRVPSFPGFYWHWMINSRKIRGSPVCLSGRFW